MRKSVEKVETLRTMTMTLDVAENVEEERVKEVKTLRTMTLTMDMADGYGRWC